MVLGKRTRFGLVFNATKLPSMGGDFLKELDVTKAEGCEKDSKHFMIFTVNKPRRMEEVAESIQGFNAVAVEEDRIKLLQYESEPEVVVFNKGNCFKTHAISKVIHGEDTYWEWSVVVDGDGRKKRAVSELSSDLVDSSIVPKFTKRVSEVGVEIGMH